MTVRGTVLAAGLVVCAVLVGLALPVAAGIYPVAQLVSFRAVIGLGALGIAAVLVALPRRRRVLFPLVVAFAVGALAQVGVLAYRSVPLGPAAGAGPDDGAGSDDRVVVLSFNTLDVVTPAELFALISAHHADVVVLPETSHRTGVEVAALMAQTGRPMQVRTAGGTRGFVSGTTLLVGERLGSYGASTSLPTRFGSLRVEPEDPASPVIVAAHPISPGARSSMEAWRQDTALIAHTCATTPGAIVAGDLNATLDHPGLRNLGPCVDAAREVGEASQGTWPSSAPTLLAAPIDHVLVDGRAWRVVDFSVLPATGGSDHRPIVAILERR
ncbi:endonuclease/exonuclease/phosphatase family protein [Cellulomonas sp. URHE0023]|uniref:endonuclease/exonuclease/phosphatase family protein n=1 Tax=Cellulomonas sp. URHE0023 TaxID=1380354 RepID=UPI000484E934|nr:endonuclease/exonuclease/phosphatase family protein [Cellulomonas sp. URHE0023]